MKKVLFALMMVAITISVFAQTDVQPPAGVASFVPAKENPIQLTKADLSPFAAVYKIYAASPSSANEMAMVESYRALVKRAGSKENLHIRLKMLLPLCYEQCSDARWNCNAGCEVNPYCMDRCDGVYLGCIVGCGIIPPLTE